MGREKERARARQNLYLNVLHFLLLHRHHQCRLNFSGSLSTRDGRCPRIEERLSLVCVDQEPPRSRQESYRTEGGKSGPHPDEGSDGGRIVVVLVKTPTINSLR